MINTLGAIANGGAGVGDPREVRERCARVSRTVEALLAGQGGARSDGLDLAQLGAGLGIEIVRTGMPAAEITRHEAPWSR